MSFSLALFDRSSRIAFCAIGYPTFAESPFMPEWLRQSLYGTSDLPVPEMGVRLAMALLSGFMIAGIYRLVRPREIIVPTFPATLVLLSILCALLPLIIGQNVAWAFGLVGALSIVRFRTVVEDTHDIAFVIFAVLTGMAVGAGRMPVAGIGMVVVGIAAFLVKPSASSSGCWVTTNSKLALRVTAGSNPDASYESVFERYVEKFELVSGATGQRGKVFDFKYKVRLKPNVKPTDLIEELTRIEPVQSVELRR
ncbi:DUF4956 domain-containing protein [Fuerstiella marisgermanici]|nr:DUF4956 domain-containing protein [Fuerstiella marisgermanici]